MSILKDMHFWLGILFGWLFAGGVASHLSALVGAKK